MLPSDHEVERRRLIELEFWRTSPDERPEADSLANLVNKAVDASSMYHLLQRYSEHFAGAEDILELGGGQGWAACLVKRLYPDARVTTTDLSPDAVASVNVWERVFATKLDGFTACPSDDLPQATGSQDVVFCFSAAHHFVRHGRTLREIHRVLRPGGRALYLHEPACPNFFHRAAYWRVNRKRPEVPEDVLRTRDLCELAEQIGFAARADPYPTLANRREREAIYYAALSLVPMLQRALPCTVNFAFTKR